MIKILGNENYTVYYKCDCGVAGKCIIKPLCKEGTIITTIDCPVCGETERIRLTQADDKKEIKDSFSWACVVYNEITDYELKENLDD
jgi:hypothetical protein